MFSLKTISMTYGLRTLPSVTVGRVLSCACVSSGTAAVAIAIASRATAVQSTGFDSASRNGSPRPAGGPWLHFPRTGLSLGWQGRYRHQNFEHNARSEGTGLNKSLAPCCGLSNPWSSSAHAPAGDLSVIWQERQDSNPRPLVLETSALARLSYAPASPA